MKIGNMITRLFSKNKNTEKTDYTEREYDDFESVIHLPGPRTKSFLLNMTVNFYSEDLQKYMGKSKKYIPGNDNSVEE